MKVYGEEVHNVRNLQWHKLKSSQPSYKGPKAGVSSILWEINLILKVIIINPEKNFMNREHYTRHQILLVIKWRRSRYSGHVERIGDINNAKILIGKLRTYLEHLSVFKG
jgi:hypothetical protein